MGVSEEEEEVGYLFKGWKIKEDLVLLMGGEVVWLWLVGVFLKVFFFVFNCFIILVFFIIVFLMFIYLVCDVVLLRLFKCLKDSIFRIS